MELTDIRIDVFRRGDGAGSLKATHLPSGAQVAKPFANGSELLVRALVLKELYVKLITSRSASAKSLARTTPAAS